MQTSPSRQSPEGEDGDEDSEAGGVAVDVSVPDVSVVSVLSAGVGEADVCGTESVVSDTVEAVCDPAEDTAVVSESVTLSCWTASVVGVARGVAAVCSWGAFAVDERFVDELSLDRFVSAGVAEAGTGAVACSSAMPMACLSGAEAACVRSVDCRFIEVTVRPPPTRATAVATRALRWVFFQRSRWRRRAARPVGVRGGASGLSYGCSCGASPLSSALEFWSCHRWPGDCHGAATGSGAGAVVPTARGAMSGA
jgi:hypothetical protein